jgi:hypothetical protein
VHGRDAGRGCAVADAIAAAGGKARFVAADLTNPAQVDHLAEQAGPVDVLVSNAGFSWFGPTADLDVATFDRLFAANVRSAYFLVAALGPKMAARASGSIISFGSMAGQIGLAGGAAYGATKATLGPDDRVRPARDEGGARVVQQRGQPAAGGLVGQDAILVAVDDQDGQADRDQVAPEVFQAGGDAAEDGTG